MSDLEAELATKFAELKAASSNERRFITHDATVEKLGELLRDNPRGMLILRDELSGWLRTMDKPGHEGEREFYLEGWNGTGSFTVDRIGRGTIHIPSLTISVFGGIQPGKLRSLIDSAVDGGFGDDGLLQRLQLSVWPDRLPPWVKPDRWPDKDARDNVAEIFASLAAMVGETVGAAHDEIPYLRFSPFAQRTADAWRDALEERLRSDELEDTPAFASHLAKYRSLMPALALLFYLIDRAANAPGTSHGAIAEHHVRLAIEWCEFLEAHARKVYAVELQGSVAAAHALADKIRAGVIYDGQPVRELYRPQWAGLRTPERVQAGLAELIDVGWVRLESKRTDGRPSQVVRLHPDLVESPSERLAATDKTDESEEGGS